MSNMKIVPLIAAAEAEAEVRSAAEMRELIGAIDAQIAVLEAQLELKLEQIQERVTKLEAGVTPQTSA
jgi:hypothetical protein